MEVQEILKEERRIWGDEKLSLEKVIIRMGKVFGDICKWGRNAEADDAEHSETEIKKELGNIITSTVRWCDDLGYDPEECIQTALNAQEKFAIKNPNRR